MSDSRSSEPFWQWPEAGTETPEGDGGQVNILSIPNPYGYGRSVPAMCYPGTPIRPDAIGSDRNVEDLEKAEDVEGLISRHVNNIGTHTHGRMESGVWVPDDHETGFGDAGVAERGAVWMIASQLGGRYDTVDGFFCGGGTDANIMGIWVGRQWLRNRPDPMNRGIVILATPIVHYSVMKAADLTDIGRSQAASCPTCRMDHILLGDRSGAGMAYVGMDKQGRMHLPDLERVFRLKYEEGFRRFIVVGTAGTTVLGSVDPVAGISDLVERLHRETNAHLYVHVDASFGGFTVPFVNPDAKIGFENRHVMSITVDADKMGHLPYPAGVFLCRRGLQSLVARKVAYVRGNEDDTLPGSRSAIAPLLAYRYYRRIGVSGQRDYVHKCMDKRNELCIMLEEIGDERLAVGPVPAETNFLPISVDIEDGEIPEAICEEKGGRLTKYHLRRDFVPSNLLDVNSCPRIVYKLCIMPHHTTEHLRQFADDLKSVLQETH